MTKRELDNSINEKKEGIDAMVYNLAYGYFTELERTALKDEIEVKKIQLAKFLVENSPHHKLLFNCRYCSPRPTGECSCG